METVTYHDQSTADRTISTLLFSNLDFVDSELFEIKGLTKQITFDLPLQVGLFVYSLAKLKMLSVSMIVLKNISQTIALRWTLNLFKSFAPTCIAKKMSARWQSEKLS